MVLSSSLAPSSLSFLACIVPVFIPFLSPMRSQESQPTLNYSKLLLKLPCHTWGKNAFAFACSGLVLPTYRDQQWWLLVALASGLLFVLAEPNLACIAAFGRHPFQGSLIFRNRLFFLSGTGSWIHPLCSCTWGTGQRALRSEPGMMSTEFKVSAHPVSEDT